MSRTPPNHRYLDTLQRVSQGKSAVTDGLVSALARALRGEDDVPAEVAEALYIYRDSYQREVLDTFLLVKVDPEEIQLLLEIETAVVEVYQHLFFDSGVFRNRLDRESYARTYDGDDESTDHEYGRELKIAAMQHGKHWLLTRWGVGVGHHADAYIAAKEMLSQSYLLSKNGMDHAIDSAKAREARQWASTLTSAISGCSDAAELGTGKDRDVLIKLRLLEYGQDRVKRDAHEDRELTEVTIEDIVHTPEDSP